MPPLTKHGGGAATHGSRNRSASQLYPGFLTGRGDFDNVDPTDAVLLGVEDGHSPVCAVADPVQQFGVRQPFAARW